jgi:hypothetical protein
MIKGREPARSGEILPADMKKSTTFKVIGLFTVFNIQENCDGNLIKL